MGSAPEVSVHTPAGGPGPARASVSRAVGLGVGVLKRIPRVWGFGLVVEGFSSVAQAAVFGLALATVAQQALVAAMDGSPEGTPGAFGSIRGALACLAGTGVSLAALGAALRVFYLAAAVPSIAASVKDPLQPAPPFLSAAAGGLARATVASIWLFFVELGSKLLLWLSFASAVVGVAGAFSRHRWVAASILEASAASVVMLAMALLPSIFGRVYLIRAIRSPSPSLVNAWDAAGQIFSRSRGRLGTYLGLVLMGWLSLAIAGTVAQGPRVMGSLVGPGHAALQVSLAWFGSLLAGLAGATVELGVLGAFCAIDLDCAGELPPPPKSPPRVVIPTAEAVLVAQEILTAQALPDPGSSAPRIFVPAEL